jgi:EAL domain-containing protein (putative c-di-GMP-specific phosphodiesterase class I)
MPITVILAVGLDPWLLTTQSSVWQSAGYIFTSVGSKRDAIDQFRVGDFDLVLVCPSIPVENRERLTSLIRGFGSRTPVVCIESDSGDCDASSLATLKSEHKELVANIEELLAEKARISTVSSAKRTNPYLYEGRGAETTIKNTNGGFENNANGVESCEHFRPDRKLRTAERKSIEQDLLYALEGNELTLHYQPKVDLKTGAVLGTEAFSRWTHPTRGSVPPAQFIPIAEESSLILSIGAWALRKACSQARSWFDAGSHAGSVAVNLSEVQIQHDGFPDFLFATLSETGLNPQNLELDISSTVLMKHPERTIPILKSIKDRGVKISADNMGHGYCSLGSIRKLPLDALKIDGAFVRRIGRHPEFEMTVRSTIKMGQSLNLRVIAGDVETAGHLEYLWDHNCDEAQGYFLGEPVSPEKLSLPSARAGGLNRKSVVKELDRSRTALKIEGAA